MAASPEARTAPARVEGGGGADAERLRTPSLCHRVDVTVAHPGMRGMVRNPARQIDGRDCIRLCCRIARRKEQVTWLEAGAHVVVDLAVLCRHRHAALRSQSRYLDHHTCQDSP